MTMTFSFTVSLWFKHIFSTKGKCGCPTKFPIHFFGYSIPTPCPLSHLYYISINLFVCMCIYIYIYIFRHIYVCVSCVCVVCVCVCVCVYVCVCLSIYLCLSLLAFLLSSLSLFPFFFLSRCPSFSFFCFLQGVLYCSLKVCIFVTQKTKKKYFSTRIVSNYYFTLHTRDNNKADVLKTVKGWRWYSISLHFEAGHMI